MRSPNAAPRVSLALLLCGAALGTHVAITEFSCRNVCTRCGHKWAYDIVDARDERAYCYSPDLDVVPAVPRCFGLYNTSKQTKSAQDKGPRGPRVFGGPITDYFSEGHLRWLATYALQPKRRQVALAGVPWARHPLKSLALTWFSIDAISFASSNFELRSRLFKCLPGVEVSFRERAFVIFDSKFKCRPTAI